MLNYIWLALIIIGLLVAIGYDVSDLWNDTYRNGQSMPVALEFERLFEGVGKEFPCRVKVSRERFEDLYGVSGFAGDTVSFQGTYKPAEGRSGSLAIALGSEAPRLWREMADAQGGDPMSLKGRFTLARSDTLPAGVPGEFIADPVKFVKLNKVTNEGAIQYAKIAVQIAIGLIGIMALWLGVMKIAEESGLVAKIARGLRPVLTRLFPDVPAEHPAMGAMVMNIAANVLGLANAATPLGLKAMEELNTLNRKLGTATDAMCTFLVINTSNVQLIPATVIAIRAAAGSANPTEILGPVIVATTISTVVGVATVKLLSRLPLYRKQLEER